MPVILALKKPKQEDHEFEDSLPSLHSKIVCGEEGEREIKKFLNDTKDSST